MDQNIQSILLKLFDIVYLKNYHSTEEIVNIQATLISHLYPP